MPHLTETPPPSETLFVEGARQNNLKNISLGIPHNQVTAVTVLSGSGKSSFAFDTLFAEGQWRYVESLSTYARMFLDKVARPDVDRILNIRPAIAIEQKNQVRTARSTVGTATEIADLLRLLFAKLGSSLKSGLAKRPSISMGLRLLHSIVSLPSMWSSTGWSFGKTIGRVSARRSRRRSAKATVAARWT